MAKITAFQNKNTGAFFRIGEDTEEAARLAKIPHMVKGYEENGVFVPVDRTEVESLREEIAKRDAALAEKQTELEQLNGEIVLLSEQMQGKTEEIKQAMAAQNTAAITKLQSEMIKIQEQITAKRQAQAARTQGINKG